MAVVLCSVSVRSFPGQLACIQRSALMNLPAPLCKLILHGLLRAIVETCRISANRIRYLKPLAWPALPNSSENDSARLRCISVVH